MNLKLSLQIFFLSSSRSILNDGTGRIVSGFQTVPILTFQKRLTNAGTKVTGHNLDKSVLSSAVTQDMENFQPMSSDVLGTPDNDRSYMKNQNGVIGTIPSSMSTSTNSIQKNSLEQKSADKTADKEVMIARLLVLVAAALYGTNFAVVKNLGVYDIPTEASTFLRFFLASLVTSFWLFSPRKPPSSSSAGMYEDYDIIQEETDLKLQSDSSLALLQTRTAVNEVSDFGPMMLGMEVGIWNAIGYISQALGLQTVDASKSAFICSLAVIFVPIYDTVFLGKKMSTNKILGILSAVMGVAFIELGGDQLAQLTSTTTTFFSSLSHLQPDDTLSSLSVSSIISFDFINHMKIGNILGSFDTGYVLSFMQPLAFGMGFWKMEHAAEKYPDEAKQLTSWNILSVALASFAFWLFSSSSLHSSTMLAPEQQIHQIIEWLTNPMLLLSLIWTGVVTTALTLYLETLALKSIPATEATLFFSTEPIWGSVFAAMLLGEHLGMEAGIGAILILCGCYIGNTNQKAEENS